MKSLSYLGIGTTQRPRRSGVYNGMFGGRPLWYTGESHILGVGPTRSGKFASILAAVLKTYPGSVLVHDPAFEIAATTARWRATWTDVFFVNPFGTLVGQLPHLDLTSDGLNFMAAGPLDPNDPNFAVYYDNLARDATEFTPNNPFWYHSAVNLRAAYFMANRIDYGNKASMFGVQRAMLGIKVDPDTGNEQFLGRTAILKEMFASGYDPIVTRVYDYLVEDETRNNVFKHVASEMGCFSLPQIRADEKGKRYNFELAKYKPITVYFGAPNNIKGIEVWKKLVLGQMLRDISSTLPGDIDPLIVLDEAKQFGQMEAIVEFWEFGAKSGGRLFSVWQGFEQIEKTFKDSASIGRGSRGALWALPPKDDKDADQLRRYMGKKTEQTRSYNAHVTMNEQGAAGLTDSAQVFDVMTNDEMMRLDGKLICLVEPVKYPFIADAPHYYTVPWLREGLDPNPYHARGLVARHNHDEQLAVDYQELLALPPPEMTQ